ncbi:MAG: PhoU family transcriptional regulator [Planctomycetia bacterium]|nr:PhoU family transcriptional regulator [Planctomycetia bacterium]
MLGALLAALRGGDALDKAFGEFDEMLTAGQWMFHEVHGVLAGGDPADVREAVFTRDQDINRLLRSLRSNIVTHLSVNRNADIAACLALMSIAKDAERIGDYCKNLYEVTEHGGLRHTASAYEERIRTIPDEIEKIFELVRTAFRNSDTKEAKVAIKAADAVRKACEDLATELLDDRSTISTQEAVTCSMQTRYFKRIASHLANISTAVFGRIEDLDFRKPPKPDATGQDAS